jgi:small subunit ribosomal protein S3
MQRHAAFAIPFHPRDFGVATAFTTYGTCGVKVWIFKGEILEHDPMAQDKKLAEGDSGRPRREPANA